MLKIDESKIDESKIDMDPLENDSAIQNGLKWVCVFSDCKWRLKIESVVCSKEKKLNWSLKVHHFSLISWCIRMNQDWNFVIDCVTLFPMV